MTDGSERIGGERSDRISTRSIPSNFDPPAPVVPPDYFDQIETPFPFGKPRYREKMRNLSMPEKVRVIVELQKMIAPILRARGENPHIWQIEEAETAGKEGDCEL